MKDGDRRFGRVLGIMSGTSLDGVDCVLTAFDRVGNPRWVRSWMERFPARLRQRLMACAGGEATSWECGQLHHDLGRYYATVARTGLGDEGIDAVGLHGQTVFHRGGRRNAATWQIGEPAYLGEALRVPVVSNFRSADIAAGGEGAPMATSFHVRVFGERGRHVCVQNLGGIGNVTSIDWRAGPEPTVRSFDTGPGNMLMDGAVRRLSRGRKDFDREGKWAAAGTVHDGLVGDWLRHPFLRRQPPKSTGREAFGIGYLEKCWASMEEAGLERNDRLATLTELTARSVALNYRLHLPGVVGRIILCGGGASNPVLVARLRRALEAWTPGVDVATSTAMGWPLEAVEGGAFAWLARQRLLGRTGNLPETTGATRAVRCGQVTECG